MGKEITDKKEFVKKWMEGYEPDTFVKNEHGVVIYSAGPSSLNLTLFFEDLYEDAVIAERERLISEIRGKVGELNKYANMKGIWSNIRNGTTGIIL